MVKVGGEALEVSPKGIKLLVVLLEASEFIYSSTATVGVTVHAVQSFEDFVSINKRVPSVMAEARCKVFSSIAANTVWIYAICDFAVG